MSARNHAAEMALVSREANTSGNQQARHDAAVQRALSLAMNIISMEARNGATRTRTSIGYPHTDTISKTAQIEACGILRDRGYRIWDHVGGTVMASWESPGAVHSMVKHGHAPAKEDP